jgi:FkbM family methyltransferase
MAGWLSSATLPILRGPLAGKRWLLASRLNFFLGTYEPEQTQAFQKAIQPGNVIYDIGAHYGYYSVLASVLTGPSGQVFAFEPVPANIARLQTHLRLNHCSNVSVEKCAISDQPGTAGFDNRGGSGTGHLAEDGALEVRTNSLDALGVRLPAPQVIKIDVEGSELLALKGGEHTIRSSLPTIFLSTHGEFIKQKCFNLLDSWGYEFTQLHRDDYLLVPRVRPFSA